MDGANIHHITFKNITMANIVSPIYIFLGARLRGPFAKPSIMNDSLIGSIRDISITDIVITAGKLGKRWGNHTNTIEGQPIDMKFGISDVHYIGPNITISRVSSVMSGGGAANDVTRIPQHQTDKYPPRYLGIRPAYGFFLRRVHGVTISNVDVTYNVTNPNPEGRPGFVLTNVSDVRFIDVTAAHAQPKLGYDIGLRGECTGVNVAASSSLVVRNITGESSNTKV